MWRKGYLKICRYDFQTPVVADSRRCCAFGYNLSYFICIIRLNPLNLTKQLRRARRYRPLLPQALLPAHRICCHSCGLEQLLPPLKQGKAAFCPRCRHPLARVEANPFMLPPALALASLIMLVLVFSTLFMQITVLGMNVPLTLSEMMKVLILQESGFLAEVMFVLTFGAPFLFCLLCLYVYGGLLWGRPPPGVLRATRWLVRLRGWMMVDVFFISTLVAYIKLGKVAQVHFGPAFYLMFVLAVLLIRTAQSVPEHWVYYQIRRLRGDRDLVRPEGGSVFCGKCLFERPAHETECGICGSGLHRRRPNSLSWSLALLLTALVLLLPANLMTIMVSSNPTVIERSTIFSGIQFMWRDGDHYIAMIIFSASIMVPWLKIAAMGVLLYAAKFGSKMAPHRLSKLYLITESIGRWSMIDIFVIIMLMSTFRTHLARVVPGPAAVYFCIVVLLTMLSAHFFDPRLVWDKARRGGGGEAGAGEAT